MQPSANRKRAGCKADHGLTLIELMIVVFILSLFAVPAMLRFGGGLAGRDTRPSAERVASLLASDIEMMRDHALLGRRRLVLGLHPDGWAETRLEDVLLSWRIVDGQIVGRDNLSVEFLSDGRATGFFLRIDVYGQRPWTCDFDGWTEFKCLPG